MICLDPEVAEIPLGGEIPSEIKRSKTHPVILLMSLGFKTGFSFLIWLTTTPCLDMVGIEMMALGLWIRG